MKQRHTYTLLVLFVINLLNFYDRQLLGAVAESIKKEWDLTDAELGGLGTAFTLLYAFVGVPLGRWADLGSRKTILALGVTVWSAMTALSGLAFNFWSLFVFRLGVGVGEASCAPAANSLIGDLFTAEKRARAISIFMLGLPLGLGLGFILGGLLAEHFGWRMAMISAGVPGLLAGLLVLGIHEPARGTTEKHSIGAARRPGSALLNILRIPTMWWIILSGVLHNFNMYALGTFLSAFFQRRFDMKAGEAGFYSGITYGFSGGLGIILGGWLCDWIVRRRIQGRMEVAAGALLLFAPFTYLAMQSQSETPWALVAWLSPACFFAYIYYAGVYPTIQDIVEPSLRGTAMAVYFFAFYLLGASLGPYGLGWASDLFARRAAAMEGVQIGAAHRMIGLQQAMELIPLIAIALVVVLIAGAMTVKKDHERLQEWMRANS